MKKVLLGLLAVVVVLVAGVGIALATVDANKYRQQISDVLSKQTGRTVSLKGPISLGLSFHGAVLKIQDATISNPSWASRPNMAGIGNFELGVALMPLLDKQVSITEVKIKDADILLETSADGKHNYDMAAAAPAPDAKPTKSVQPSGQAVAIQVDNVSITDSQIATRAEGKTSVFKTSLMTFGHEHGGVALHFEGQYNGAPIKLDLKSGADDFASTSMEALDVDLTYAAYHIKAKGKASLGGKKANISDYEVSAGKSTIHGQLAANWGGARPDVKGTLQSDKLDPKDFTPAESGAASVNGEAQATAASSSKYVFSDAPLALDGLKAADAAFDVNISELTVGGGTLTNLSSKLSLAGGKLSAPVKFTLGTSPMNGQMSVNADASPAQVALTFSAPNAELQDLLHFAGAPAFLTGKANTDINVTTAGNSLHQMAEHANGKIDVIGGSGTISKSAAGSLSSGLMEILGGSNVLNCMVARFVITNGDMKDNGILLDTGATTISGKGDINLGAEVINLTLRARNKVVSAANVLPPLHVSGTFKDPSFNVDPNAIVQNVAGALLSGSLPNVTDSGVPTMQTAAGQNSCVYTVEHPVAATASTTQKPLLPGAAGAQQKIKDVGGQLMKGLFGK